MTSTALNRDYGKIYNDWAESIANRDRQSLRSLLVQNWFGTDVDGMTSDTSNVQRFIDNGPSKSSLTEHSVIARDEVAIVRGLFTESDRTSAKQYRFMALWQDTGDGPRCLTHHNTRVVESAFSEKPLTGGKEHVLTSMASEDTISELTAIYDRLHLAMPAQDLAYLDSVIDDHWFTTDPGGELRNKDQYMDFARQYYAPTLTFTISELFVREFKSVAVVSCRYRLGGSFRHGVAPNQDVRVTGIWQRSPEGWQYIAQQGSFIP